MLHSLEKGDQVKDLHIGVDFNSSSSTSNNSAISSSSTASSSCAESVRKGGNDDHHQQQQQDEEAGEQQQEAAGEQQQDHSAPEPLGSLWQQQYPFASRGMSLAPSGLGQPVLVVTQEVRSVG
jgi:hypothetical protein